MSEIITSLLSTILGWATVLGFLIAGGVGIWGLIDTRVRDRRKDALEGADSLIETLNKTIDEMKKRLEYLEGEHNNHEKQITELRATNETLTKILQGRDDNTQKFQRTLLNSADQIKEMHELMKSTETSIQTMADAITKLINSQTK